MTLTRAARCAAVLLATGLPAGCVAKTDTLGISTIALAGGGLHGVRRQDRRRQGREEGGGRQGGGAGERGEKPEAELQPRG